MSEATLAAHPSPQAQKRLACFPSNISTQNNFGLIRLSLAVLVILSHSYGISGSGRHDPLVALTNSQMDLGGLAVDWFFTLSGFLIACSWLQTSSFSAYLKKRSLRIYPGLIAAVLFCMLVVGPLACPDLAGYLRSPETYRFAQVLLLRDAFSVKGLPGVFHTNPFPNFVDGSLWTIRYEMLCYLLVPVLAVCGLLRRRKLFLFLFLSLVGLFHHYASGFGCGRLNHSAVAWSSSLDNLPRLVIFFLAGVTFYLWRERIPRSPVLLCVALAALVISRGHNTAPDHYFRRLNYILPLAGTYIIFYAAYAKSLLPQLSRLTQKHDLSYGVYLYGFPVQQLLAHYAQVYHIALLHSTVGLFSVATVISLGLARLSWKYIEKPCLKLKAVERPQRLPKPVSAVSLPALNDPAMIRMA